MHGPASSLRRALLGLALIFGWWTSPCPRAAAQSPTVTTTVDACVPVDAQQFERVLALELGTSIDYSAGETSGPGITRVHLSCTDQGIQLRLEDGVTRKSMVRVLDTSRIEAGSRTRLLALAVAEFVVASWVELRMADKPVVEPVGAPPSAAERDLAAGVATRHVVAPEPDRAPVRLPEPRAPWELGALFRLEGWSGDPGLAPLAALRLGQRPTDNLAFVIGADFGVTRVAVELGQVQVTMASVMGALLFVVRVAKVDLSAGAGGRFGLAQMTGIPSDSRVRGLSFVAPYGGALMLGKLSYHVTSAFRLLAELEGGIVTLPAEARAGPKLVVDLNGAWLSGALGVGWSF